MKPIHIVGHFAPGMVKNVRIMKLKVNYTVLKCGKIIVFVAECGGYDAILCKKTDIFCYERADESYRQPERIISLRNMLF